MNIGILKIALPLLLEGLKTTICISILAILLSFIFGGLIGILYISKNKVFHLIAYVYIKIFRNIPFMVQVYLCTTFIRIKCRCFLDWSYCISIIYRSIYSSNIRKWTTLSSKRSV